MNTLRKMILAALIVAINGASLSAMFRRKEAVAVVADAKVEAVKRACSTINKDTIVVEKVGELSALYAQVSAEKRPAVLAFIIGTIKIALAAKLQEVDLDGMGGFFDLCEAIYNAVEKTVDEGGLDTKEAFNEEFTLLNEAACTRDELLKALDAERRALEAVAELERKRATVLTLKDGFEEETTRVREETAHYVGVASNYSQAVAVVSQEEAALRALLSGTERERGDVHGRRGAIGAV